MIVVEDGSGLPNAESYVSLAEASSYAQSKGLSFPTSPAEPAEQALRRATGWIDAKYWPRFPGIRQYGRAQALEWPRVGARDAQDWPVAVNAVPVEVAKATVEAAVRELAEPGTLAPDEDRQIDELTAGSVTIKWNSAASLEVVRQAVSNALASLLKPGFGLTGRVVRS